jgi:protein tyrosine/serine phosphatase
MSEETSASARPAPSDPPVRARSVIAVLAIVGALIAVCASVVVAHSEQWVWDHFDVVVPGTLYRSGYLSPPQLEAAVKRLGIRTVVCLLRDAPDVDAERAVLKRLGVDMLWLPMPGDGFGREEQFREALKVISDPARGAVLVHCARGTCRTGATVGLYRYEVNGWTIEDVTREMKRHTYRHEWLPGYVFAMVKDRPFDELYHPRSRFETYRQASSEERRDER